MIFDQIISELQEVLISPDFEATLSSFMKNNWDGTRKEAQVFADYTTQLKNYIQNVSIVPLRTSEERCVTSAGHALTLSSRQERA